MPGHAGFAYGFAVDHGGGTDRWFLRLPPPNVRWEGTADMLRQVTALQALDGSDVPHCHVQWYGGRTTSSGSAARTSSSSSSRR